MTGDAPQPGETPRNDSNLWSYREPDAAWWRPENERQQAGEPAAGNPRLAGPATKAPARTAADAPFAAEALDAHAAGVHDATEAITTPDAPTEEPAVPADDTDAPDPTGPDTDDSPDVMVLPEPGRNRPTVSLDRNAVPGQSRPQLSPAREAALERMENSPFWMTDEERAALSETGARVAAPGAELRGKPPRVKPRTPRRPLPGLLALVALALVAAFFAWVSAEPFWLAVGHGDRGTATVTKCAGSGITQRCIGTFAAEGYSVADVSVLGLETAQRTPGATVPGRMVSESSGRVYAGDTGPLLHLRWMLGFLLVLLCGYGVAGLTGARRLATPRSRRAAVLLSLAGPLLLLVGFLVAAY